MNDPKYSTQRVCKHCHSGNITFRTVYIGSVNRRSSWWYDCHNCGFFSNGRTSLKQAEADAVLIDIDTRQPKGG